MEEVTTLGECVKALDADLIQSGKGAEMSVQRAEAAETEVERLQHASREQDATYEREMAELRAVLTANEKQMDKIREESLREREAVSKSAALEHYWALEEERHKLEERVQRLLQQLDATKREYARGVVRCEAWVLLIVHLIVLAYLARSWRSLRDSCGQ